MKKWVKKNAKEHIMKVFKDLENDLMQQESDPKKLEEDKKKREEAYLATQKARDEKGAEKDRLLEEQRQRERAAKEEAYRQHFAKKEWYLDRTNNHYLFSSPFSFLKYYSMAYLIIPLSLSPSSSNFLIPADKRSVAILLLFISYLKIDYVM